ncbi:choline transporter-like protein 1 [Zophobas morio]|uniref:choline transporter-like protein 1 n=1 Tax=Zophobas morio TaxID=2755281 RepID=UPI0030833931
MDGLERDENDPEYKKIPPGSVYEFKGIDSREKINIPEIPRNRQCTNIFCCFPVLLICLSSLGLAIYVAVSVDVRRFVNGEDECGNICGIENTKVSKPDCEPQDYTNMAITSYSDRSCVHECKDDRVLIFNRCISKENDIEIDVLVYYIFNVIFKSGVSALVMALLAIGFILVVLVAFRYATAFTFWFFVVVMILLTAAFAGLFWYLSMIIQAIIMTVILIIYFAFLFILLWTGRHKLVIALIREASIAIFNIPILLAFPVTTLIILLGLDGFTIYLVMAYLSSTEDEISEGLLTAFWLLWAIGMILMHAFVNGFQWMVIAGSVAGYYFTKDKYQVGNTEFVNSFYVTIRYHLGTISAGSLIITILSIIRAAAELARDNVDDASVAIVILYYCLLCCVACIEEIADYLAKKAYIITAMHGKGLLNSGTRAVRLICMFLLDLVMVDQFSYLMVNGAAMVILLITLGIGFAMHLNDWSDYFIFLIILGVYLISTILYFYFSLLNASIETTFLCFCEDKLMNDGSSARPYYMTKSLSNLMVQCTDVAKGRLFKRREKRLERQRRSEDNN